jgi:hypothetical protein
MEGLKATFAQCKKEKRPALVGCRWFPAHVEEDISR